MAGDAVPCGVVPSTLPCCCMLMVPLGVMTTTLLLLLLLLLPSPFVPLLRPWVPLVAVMPTVYACACSVR